MGLITIYQNPDMLSIEEKEASKHAKLVLSEIRQRFKELYESESFSSLGKNDAVFINMYEKEILAKLINLNNITFIYKNDIDNFVNGINRTIFQLNNLQGKYPKLNEVYKTILENMAIALGDIYVKLGVSLSKLPTKFELKQLDRKYLWGFAVIGIILNVWSFYYILKNRKKSKRRRKK